MLDNGTKVVAVSAGRPKYEKGVISIVPVFSIPHDVDIRTGNVRFDGDIVIRGNICENLKVYAGGDITVFGNIYHAYVRAKGNIQVHGSVINSNVSAGSNMLNYMGAVPKLKQILEVVKECKSLVNLSEMTKNSVRIRKKLHHALLTKKDIICNLMKDIQNLVKLSNDEENIELIMILDEIKRTMTGINAKGIEDPEQIKTLYTKISDYIKKIQELYGKKADVVFEYGQNSFVQANGNIVVTERGCYQTNLIARNAILFKKRSSIVRGGLLIAGKRIKMGTVGSPSGISTYCKVLDRNGKIEAVYYYSNTILSINGSTNIIDSNFYNPDALNESAL